MADNPIEAIEALDESAETLGDSLGAAGQMAAEFDGELRRVRTALAETGKDAAALERGLSRGLRKAFDGLVFGGDSLSDALDNVAQTMIRTTYNAALAPVTRHVGGLLADGAEAVIGSILPFEKGGSIAQGRVMPFAKGGVVSGATTFPMRGATGLMGEAGPEAIMPLTRGPDGALGVRASGAGGRAPTVVMNISTPDVAGFRRSQSQIAAQMGQALRRGGRNR